MFLVAYIGCQVALLFLGSTPLRAPLRVGTFSVSLLMLSRARAGGESRHPGAALIPLILLSFAPGLLHPELPSVVAAVAQATLYLATLAPLLWVPGEAVSRTTVRWVLVLLWAFNLLSAVVGVAQVHKPGLFQNQLSTVVSDRGVDYVGSLKIELADGTRTFRPMGLTDAPGGAATGGLYSILLGLGLLFTERKPWIRATAVGGIIVGLFVIYLSYVRLTFVMAGVGAFVVAATFARRGDRGRVTTLISILAVTVFVGTIWAFTVGGAGTVNRFATLFDSAPVDVYSQNRGFFLRDTFERLIFEYPLGAGAGRWGMISYYFGGGQGGLWAEINWTAWLYDGGILLIVAYCALLARALLVAWRIGTNPADDWLAVWGAVLLAYNVAAIAATFSGPAFCTQGGMEVWFLNACVFAAWNARAASLHTSSAKIGT